MAIAGSNLRGVVQGEGGLPLRGGSVYVYTASPRSGTSSVCPSCYADCGKSRTTNSRGEFFIPNVSDSLLFRILAVARGYEPRFIERVDPRGEPLHVTLQRKSDGIGASLKGRILDPDGRRVVGATVTPIGVIHGGHRKFGANLTDAPLAVTDGAGEFQITTHDDSGRYLLRVEARGLAPQMFGHVTVSTSPAVLRMAAGASVSGQVLGPDGPIAGVLVGLVQVERDAATFLGAETIATDAGGRFLFANVAPDQGFLVYTKMSSVSSLGAASSESVAVGHNNTITTVPPLRVLPGRSIRGHVRLTDGRGIPAGTRLTVSREEVWDYAEVTLPGDGFFSLTNLPSEDISLAVRMPGYSFQPSNGTALDPYRRVLQVKLDRDILDLEVQMEPTKDGAR